MGGFRVIVVKNEFRKVAARLGPAILSRMPPVLMNISAVAAEELAELSVDDLTEMTGLSRAGPVSGAGPTTQPMRSLRWKGTRTRLPGTGGRPRTV